MVGELLRFVVLWLCLVLFFATLAQLWFGKLEAFSTKSESFTNMLFAALGSYDPKWFEKLKYPALGIYFLVFYLVVNILLLTNYVIAIMTDRYTALEQSRLGLFYDGLVSSMSEYKYDSRYGFLIANVIPFNIFSLMLAPIFYVIHNENTLRKINSKLMLLAYSPVAIIATVIFFLMNVVMFPFAWIIAVLKKF